MSMKTPSSDLSQIAQRITYKDLYCFYWFVCSLFDIRMFNTLLYSWVACKTLGSKKRKVYSSFSNNIWGVDLSDVQSLSKYNIEKKYLLCAIDLLSKYMWVVPIKDKKRAGIVNAFQKIISEGRKPNKIWLTKVVSFIIILLKIF